MKKAKSTKERAEVLVGLIGYCNTLEQMMELTLDILKDQEKATRIACVSAIKDFTERTVGDNDTWVTKKDVYAICMSVKVD